jgi:iron complex transport system substrate-binding protein
MPGRVRASFVLLPLLVMMPRVLAAADASPAPPPPTPAVPARIVSLAPSVTETLFALGAGSRVVAVSDYCDYPPEVTELPRVGSFNAPNVEAVLAARPDVVIGMPSPGNHENVLTLRRLGVRVEIVDADRLAELAAVTRRIAEIAGVPEAGARLVAGMTRDLDAVRRKVAGAPKPRALVLVGQDPLIAAGPKSFLGEMLAEAGAVNVAPPNDSWPHLNVEVVIAADPEVIVDCSMGTEAGTAAHDYWTRFPSLTAVKNGRVYPFTAFEALRPGPRIAIALEELARLIHPERF